MVEAWVEAKGAASKMNSQNNRGCQMISWSGPDHRAWTSLSMAAPTTEPLLGVDQRSCSENSGNPVAAVSVDGVSLRRASMPAPLDTGAEPHQAKMAILSELHAWSGGVMRSRHPPGSWLTRN